MISIIWGVAITGVDGQSRTSDDLPKLPLQVRSDQKIAKYGRIVDENTIQFVPAIFSYTGQIYAVYKCLIKEQIRQKLKYSEE